MNPPFTVIQKLNEENPTSSSRPHMAQGKTRGLRTDPRITLLVAYNKDEMKELNPAIIPLNEFLSLLLHLILFRGNYLVNKSVGFATLSSSSRSAGSVTFPGCSATVALLRLGHKVNPK